MKSNAQGGRHARSVIKHLPAHIAGQNWLWGVVRVIALDQATLQAHQDMCKPSVSIVCVCPSRTSTHDADLLDSLRSGFKSQGAYTPHKRVLHTV
jgi:hypothetical protein